MYEFVAREGEAVLFPPGWIHETLNTAEGCTAALTTQFSVPLPIRYWRSFYQRARRIGDLHPCWGDMIKWASLGLPKKQWEKLKPKDARSFAEKHFESKVANATLSEEQKAFYDLDEDG